MDSMDEIEVIRKRFEEGNIYDTACKIYVNLRYTTFIYDTVGDLVTLKNKLSGDYSDNEKCDALTYAMQKILNEELILNAFMEQSLDPNLANLVLAIDEFYAPIVLCGRKPELISYEKAIERADKVLLKYKELYDECRNIT